MSVRSGCACVLGSVDLGVGVGWGGGSGLRAHARLFVLVCL